MRPIRLFQALFLILSLLKALGLIVGTEVHGADATSSLYQATSMKVGAALPHIRRPPAKQVAPAELPRNLVGAWYIGALPLTDFYNPLTGEWRSQNGLGQSYQFRADGTYTYGAFLRLQTGLCLSEVASYVEGKVSVTGNVLTLTPNVAKTRTVINCGSKSESEIDGPFYPRSLTYALVEEAGGQVQLVLTENETSIYFLPE